MKYIFFGILFSFFSRLSLSQSTVVNIYVSSGSGKDAYVTNAAPTTNYGNINELRVYWNGSIFRSYIQADFSSIPTNAIVTSAKLKLTCDANDFSVAQSLQLCRVSNTWNETTITYNLQPVFTTTGAATFTTPTTTGLHTLTSVTPSHFIAQVQNMVRYPALNFGWCLKMSTESGSTRGLKYKSSDGIPLALLTSQPHIEVTYIMPITVNGVVTHCSEGFNNGLISGITYTGGTGTYVSYQWYRYNMGTVTSIETGLNFANINAENLPDGLYLLRVTDSGGNIGYKYFLVGEENTITTVEFSNPDLNNSKLFNEDAYIQSGANANLAGADNTSFQASRSTFTVTSLLKYQVDFDPSLIYQSAKLYLYGIASGHIATAGGSGIRNRTTLSRATAQWHENLVTWNTQPGINTPTVTIPETAVGTTTVTSSEIDVLSFINYWSANPLQNFGWRFDMNTTAPATQQMRYGSYDHSAANPLRPKLRLTFRVPGKSHVHATPKRTLEGGYFLVPTDDILRFEFNEEYALAGNLKYSVKNYSNVVVAGLASVSEVFGDNRIAINVASVPAGFYVLEIVNDKNETWYLRFKVQ